MFNKYKFEITIFNKPEDQTVWCNIELKIHTINDMYKTKLFSIIDNFDKIKDCIKSNLEDLLNGTIVSILLDNKNKKDKEGIKEV